VEPSLFFFSCSCRVVVVVSVVSCFTCLFCLCCFFSSHYCVLLRLGCGLVVCLFVIFDRIVLFLFFVTQYNLRRRSDGVLVSIEVSWDDVSKLKKAWWRIKRSMIDYFVRKKYDVDEKYDLRHHRSHRVSRWIDLVEYYVRGLIYRPDYLMIIRCNHLWFSTRTITTITSKTLTL
jgi:hypothetical protein